MSTLSDKLVNLNAGDTAVPNLKSWAGDGATYMTRTQVSSSINDKKFTAAFWFKRGNEGYSDSHTNSNFSPFICFGTSNTNDLLIYAHHQTNGTTLRDGLHIRLRVSSSTKVDMYTDAKIRDNGQWSHCCVTYDSTLSTESDRVKVFINGERQTQFNGTPTYPSQNQAGIHETSGIVQQIGRFHEQAGGNQHNSLITAAYFLDGVAVDPMDNFIERSTLTGTPLIPKEYSGSMEGNSFYLPMGGYPTNTDNELLLQPTAAGSTTSNIAVDDLGTRAQDYDLSAASVHHQRGNPFQGEDTAYDFSAAADYLELPITSGGDLSFGTGQFQIDFWVRYEVGAFTTTSTAHHTIFSAGYEASGSLLIQGNNNTGALTVSSYGTTLTSDSDTLSEDTWYHYVICRDSGGYVKLYRDGTLKATSSQQNYDIDWTGTATLGTTSGHSSNSDHEPQCHIGDFRVFKGGVDTAYDSSNPSAKKSSTASNCVVALQPTKSWCGKPKNEVSGGVAVTPYGHFASSLPFGDTQSLWCHAGLEGGVAISDSSDFDWGTNDFTISCWVQWNHITTSTSEAAGKRGVMRHGDPSNEGVSITLEHNSVADGRYPKLTVNGYSVTSSTTLDKDKWHYIVATRSGGTLGIAVDGSTGLDSSDVSGFSSSTSLTGGSGEFCIGSHAGSSGGTSGHGNFHGYITDFKVVNGTAESTSLATAKASKTTNTKLLLQPTSSDSSEFVDISDSSHTITAYGNSCNVRHDSLGHCGGSHMQTSGPYTEKKHSYAMNWHTNTGTMQGWNTSGYSSHQLFYLNNAWHMAGWFKFNVIGLRDNTSYTQRLRIPLITDALYGNFGYSGWVVNIDLSDLQLCIVDGVNQNSNAFDTIKPTGQKAIKPNTWHYIEISCEGSGNSNIHFFLDGEKQSTTTGATVGHNNSNSSTPSFNKGQHRADDTSDGHSHWSLFNFEMDSRVGHTTNYTVPSTISPRKPYKSAGADYSKDNATAFAVAGTNATLIDTPEQGKTYNNFATLTTFNSDTDDLRWNGLALQKVDSGNKSYAAVMGANGAYCSKKFYWEVQVQNVDQAQQYAGLAALDGWNMSGNAGEDSDGESWALLIQANAKGWYLYGGANTGHNDGWPEAFASGDIAGFAWDVAGGKIWYSKNNVWRDGNPSNGTSATQTNLFTDRWLHPVYSNYFSNQGSDGYFIANFGQNKDFCGSSNLPTSGEDTTQSEFFYAPPTGFVAMKTSEINAPVASPKSYFDIKTWDGTYDENSMSGTENQTISGLDFQPAIIWVRSRTSEMAYGNYVFDSVMGFNESAFNLDGDTYLNAQAIDNMNSYVGVTAVSSSGFTVDGAPEVNHKTDGFGGGDTPEKYVGYCWKLGKTGSSSTWSGSGTNPDTEHYNDESGVSVLKYDNTSGSLGSNLVLKHSLGKKPAFAVVFDGALGGVGDFEPNQADFYSEGHYCWHQHLDDNKYLKIDTNAAQSTWAGGDDSVAGDLTPFPSSGSTTTSFSIGDAINLNPMHVWLFAEIEGFSRFGFYQGRGNSPKYLPCGFKPRFTIIKRIDAANDWWIHDSERDGLESGLSRMCEANNSNAEKTAGTAGHMIDYNSNGIVIRNTANWDNNSSGKYIFMAFAHRPFKYANGMGGA